MSSYQPPSPAQRQEWERKGMNICPTCERPISVLHLMGCPYRHRIKATRIENDDR